MSVIRRFIVRDGDMHRTYVGHVVSRGPSTIVLLLTGPFAQAGHTAVFRIDDVVDERTVAA